MQVSFHYVWCTTTRMLINLKLWWNFYYAGVWWRNEAFYNNKVNATRNDETFCLSDCLSTSSHSGKCVHLFSLRKLYSLNITVVWELWKQQVLGCFKFYALNLSDWMAFSEEILDGNGAKILLWYCCALCLTKKSTECITGN